MKHWWWMMTINLQFLSICVFTTHFRWFIVGLPRCRIIEYIIYIYIDISKFTGIIFCSSALHLCHHISHIMSSTLSLLFARFDEPGSNFLLCKIVHTLQMCFFWFGLEMIGDVLKTIPPYLVRILEWLARPAEVGTGEGLPFMGIYGSLTNPTP